MKQKGKKKETTKQMGKAIKEENKTVRTVDGA